MIALSYTHLNMYKRHALLRSEINPSIVGEVSFERINATRFGSALGIVEEFTGETAGKIRFSATADSWASIFSAIEANGEFAMHQGSGRGDDLAEAARRGSKASVHGGLTLFESLTGRIKLSPTKYQFTGLVLKSGLMQSGGYKMCMRDRVQPACAGAISGHLLRGRRDPARDLVRESLDDHVRAADADVRA